MYCIEGSTEMVTNVMDLGMTIVASGNAVICSGIHNLIEFYLAIGPACFSMPGLEETTATAATEVVRFVWSHFHHIFCANNRTYDKSQIIGDGITKALSYDLTWVLNGEFYFALFVPVGVYFKASFTDPFGIV